MRELSEKTLARLRDVTQIAGWERSISDETLTLSKEAEGVYKVTLSLPVPERGRAVDIFWALAEGIKDFRCCESHLKEGVQISIEYKNGYVTDWLEDMRRLESVLRAAFNLYEYEKEEEQ